MKPFFQLPALCILLAAATTKLQADSPPIRFAFQVFQLNGDFTRKTSLSEDIWKGSDRDWKKIKDEVILFDEAEFRNGEDRLTMSRKQCRWNDQLLTFEKGLKAKLPGKKIKMIFSPNLIRKENELVRLKVTSKRPFQFMSGRKDGLFELKEVNLPTGLDIEIIARRGAPNTYKIPYLELDLRSVNRRESSKLTNLPIGKPILDKSEYILKLAVQEYRSYGILLQPKGSEGMVIIRFEVDDR
ncbi:MAG: hypothetical protein AAF514_09465 [Verrucomicrobiota bacterium]